MATRKAKPQARIGDMLLDAGLINQTQMDAAVLLQQESGQKIGSVLVSMGAVDEKILGAFLSLQKGLGVMHLAERSVSAEVLSLVTAETARRLGAIPIEKVNNRLMVALIDPQDAQALWELEMETGLKVKPFIAPQNSIRKALLRFYPERKKARSTPVADSSPLELPELLKMVTEARKLLETIEQKLGG